MNVRRVGTVMVLGLIVAVVVGGMTTSWQDRSCLGAKPPSEEPVRFNVTTGTESAVEIVGVFVGGSSDGSGSAVGGAGKFNVVVNRPSPAVKLDFLAEREGSPFTEGDVFGIGGGGTIDIYNPKKGAAIRYFFRGPGKDGTVVNYRLDGDAVIKPDTPGSSFPNGDPVGYTVTVSDLRVSQDTGKRGNAYEAEFRGTTAIIYLERLP